MYSVLIVERALGVPPSIWQSPQDASVFVSDLDPRVAVDGDAAALHVRSQSVPASVQGTALGD